LDNRIYLWVLAFTIASGLHLHVQNFKKHLLFFPNVCLNFALMAQWNTNQLA